MALRCIKSAFPKRKTKNEDNKGFLSSLDPIPINYYRQYLTSTTTDPSNKLYRDFENQQEHRNHKYKMNNNSWTEWNRLTTSVSVACGKRTIYTQFSRMLNCSRLIANQTLEYTAVHAFDTIDVQRTGALIHFHDCDAILARYNRRWIENPVNIYR